MHILDTLLLAGQNWLTKSGSPKYPSLTIHAGKQRRRADPVACSPSLHGTPRRLAKQEARAWGSRSLKVQQVSFMSYHGKIKSTWEWIFNIQHQSESSMWWMIFAILGFAFRTFTLPPPEGLPAKADSSSVATSIQVLPGPRFFCILFTRSLP